MDQLSRDSLKAQVQRIDQLLLQESITEVDKKELSDVKQHIVELLALTEEYEEATPGPSSLDDEYNKFMADINNAPDTEETNNCQILPLEKENDQTKIEDNQLNIHEGMKCRVPHKHKWGDVVYHDAMVVAVHNNDLVSVLYTHPTHKEMLPCPYYYDENCKFTAEKCRYSHGETVQISDLLEYVEPDFDELKIGSYVLAKKSDNLWHKGRIQDVNAEKYFVRLESNKTDIEVMHGDVYPLSKDDTSSSDDDDFRNDIVDVINKSLLITPSSQALGSWEAYTKGMGSKLMQKMGYIVGTGLGKHSEGRVEPVTAVVFPAGKSLDYCMALTSKDDDSLKSKKKLKRRQAKHTAAMEKRQTKNKSNVFDFMNKTLSGKQKDTGSKMTTNEQKEIKEASNRDLNIKNLNLAKKIHGVEMEMEGIRKCLQTSSNAASDKQSQLKSNLAEKQDELNKYQSMVQMINSEQQYRDNKKKMTQF